MELSKFKHQIKEKVKFHEVDMLGVCNNAVYFNYFEDARVAYANDMMKKYKFKDTFVGNSFFIMVHNESDYYESAHLDDELTILTRVNLIKNTSFAFEHLVVKDKSEKVIASGKGVVVHINRETKKPVQLPQEFYDAVSSYEVEVKIDRK